MLLLRLITVLATTLLLPALSTTSSAGTTDLSVLQHASVVSSKQLQNLTQSPSISMVYFFVYGSQKVRSFLKEYDVSAKYLKIYNITLAVYDCSSQTSDHKMCNTDAVGNQVYTYQNGTELLTLTLAKMFDVNSIMINALQLVLLHEVPVIQSIQEMKELQRNAKGKQHILFAYLEFFGTAEHRIFLEIAYAFHDHLKFAVTTELTVIKGLQKSQNLPHLTSFPMWVLLCGDATNEETSAEEVCDSLMYQQEVSFRAMAQFVRRLSEKMLYYAPADGLNEVFDMPDVLPIIFVYINKDMQDHTLPVFDLAKFEVGHVAKVVVVDMDNEDCQSLAKRQGFSGKLPAVAVKENGVTTFMDESEDWSADNVQEFIRQMVFQTDELGSHSDFETSHSSDQEPEYIGSAVEIQDDQIAAAVYELRTQEMELDHVPVLLKHSFHKTIPTADLKIVLFYLPFDHISMAFLREFGHAAQVLASNFSETNIMARVNCYDGTDLCAEEKITTYPVLRIYRRGQDNLDYKGSLDAKSIIKAVRLLQLKSPVLLTSEQEVQNFIKGEHPQLFHKFTPSSVLLLTTAKDSDEEKLFNNVSKSLSIMTAFGVVHDDLSLLVAKKYSIFVPSVVAFHRSDRNKPVRVLNEQLSELSLTDFVKNSLIAFVPKLTVTNLPMLFAKRQPFAILFLDPSDPFSKTAMETFTKVAMSGQFENVVFCWMDAQAKTIGESLLSEYTLMATLPMITVVDHVHGELFNFKPEQLKLEDISSWLNKVLAKQIRPSKMLEYAQWVPPGPHYDFLAMIDEVERGEDQETRAIDDDFVFSGEQQKKDWQTEQLSTAGLDQHEALRIDSELWKELLELQKSRIYRQSSERRDKNRKQHLRDQDPPFKHTHPHVEL